MFKKISLPLAVGALLFALNGTATAQDNPTPPKPPEPPKAEPKEPAPPRGDRPEGDRPPRGERPRGERREGDRRRRRGGGMEDLGLSDTQKAKMDAAMKAYREAIASARESGDWNKMREARKTYEKIVNEILTDEQKKKREEANKRRFGGRDGGRGRGGRGEGRGFGGDRGGRGFGRFRMNPEQRDARTIEEVKKALILNETQEAPVVAALKKILAERRKSRETIDKKRRSFLKALKEGAKKEEANTMLAEYRKLRTDSEASIKKLETELAGQLDDVQKAKLVAMGLMK